MRDLKISLVTVAYNAQNTIGRCIESVLRQDFHNLEYIIIDGGSTDDTLKIISNYAHNITVIVSEPDNGIYDAMNKGIALATGDVFGTLNADDYYAGDDVLAEIAKAFKQNDIDILYGDLDYVDLNSKILRKWRSGEYQQGAFNWGWMPPHPTFYCKRRLFGQFGLYKLDYGSAADYELMLRFMHVNKIHAWYLKKAMVKMTIGGVSNKSALNRVKALGYDLKSMSNNNVRFPFVTVLLKPLRKLMQFI